MNLCGLRSSRLWSRAGGADGTAQLVPACLRTAAELLQGCLSNPSYPGVLQGRHFSTAGPSNVNGAAPASIGSSTQPVAGSSDSGSSGGGSSSSNAHQPPGTSSPEHSAMDVMHSSLGVPGAPGSIADGTEHQEPGAAGAAGGGEGQPCADVCSEGRSSSTTAGATTRNSSSSSSSSVRGQVPPLAPRSKPAASKQGWWGSHSRSWRSTGNVHAAASPPTAAPAAALHAACWATQAAPAAAAAVRHSSSTTEAMTPAEMLAVHDEFTLDDLLFENQELKERDFRSWKEYVFAQIGLGSPEVIPCNEVVEDAEKEFLHLLVRTPSRHQQLQLVGAWSYFLDESAREYRSAVLRRAQQIAEQRQQTAALQHAEAAAAAAAQAQQAAAAAAAAAAARREREEELKRFTEQREPVAWGALQEAAVSEMWAALVGQPHLLAQSSLDGSHLVLSVPSYLPGPNRRERLAAAAGIMSRKARAVGLAACQLPCLEVCEPWTEARDLGLLLRLTLGHPHPALVAQCLGDEVVGLDGSSSSSGWGEGSAEAASPCIGTYADHGGSPALEDWVPSIDSSSSSSWDMQPWQDEYQTTSGLQDMLHQQSEGEETLHDINISSSGTQSWSSGTVSMEDSSSSTEALSSWSSSDMQHGTEDQLASSSSGSHEGLHDVADLSSGSSSSSHALDVMNDASSSSGFVRSSSSSMAHHTDRGDSSYGSGAGVTGSDQHPAEEPLLRLTPEQQLQQQRDEMQQQLAAIIAPGRSAPLYTGVLGPALWVRPGAWGPESPWKQLKRQVVGEELEVACGQAIANAAAAAVGLGSHAEGLPGAPQDSSQRVVVLDSRKQWAWQPDVADVADLDPADAERYAQGAAQWLRRGAAAAAAADQAHGQPSTTATDQLLELLQGAGSPREFQELVTQYAAFLTTDTTLQLMQRAVKDANLRHMLPWLLDQWDQQQQQQQQQAASSSTTSRDAPGLSLSIQLAEKLLQECLAAPLATTTPAVTGMGPATSSSSSTAGAFGIGPRSRDRENDRSSSSSSSSPWSGHHMKLLVQLLAAGTLQALPTPQLLRLAEAWPALLLRYKGPAEDQVLAAADLLQQEILGLLSQRPPRNYVDVGMQQLVQFIDRLLEVREAQPTSPAKQGSRQPPTSLEAATAAGAAGAAAVRDTTAAAHHDLGGLSLTAGFPDLHQQQQQQVSMGDPGLSWESPALWAGDAWPQGALGGSVDGLRAALAATAAPEPVPSSSSSSSGYADSPEGYLEDNMQLGYGPTASAAAGELGSSSVRAAATPRSQQLQQTYACIGIICKVLQQRMDALPPRQCIFLLERVKRWEQLADGGWSRLHGRANAAWRTAVWELQGAVSQHLVRLLPRATPGEVVDVLSAVQDMPYAWKVPVVRATQHWAAATRRQGSEPVYLNLFECDALLSAWWDLDRSRLGLDRARKSLPAELGSAMEGLGSIAAATIAAGTGRGGSRGAAAAAGGAGPPDPNVSPMRLMRFLLPYKQLQFWHQPLIGAVSSWLAQQAGQRSTPGSLTNDEFVLSQLTSFLATFHTGDAQVTRGYASLLLKLNLPRMVTSTLSQLAWGAALFGVQEKPVWQALSKALLHQLSQPVRDNSKQDAVASQHRLLMAAAYCRLTPGLSSVQLLPPAVADGWAAAARAEAAAASAEAAAASSASQSQQGPPPPAAAAAAAAGGQDMQGSVEVSVSQLQRDIFNAITLLQQDQELHISYIEQEHLIGTAGASVDILVVVNNVRVALEVDGPSHYSTNKLDGQYMPLGQTLLRDHLRQLEGLQVVRVPWFTWEGISASQRSEWLKKKLQATVANRGREGRAMARR